jgi:hypothetical protein
MPIVNIVMFAISIASYVGLKFTGHSDAATDQVLVGLASASLGAHAGATVPALGGSK